jgi:hypothetical protein
VDEVRVEKEIVYIFTGKYALNKVPQYKSEYRKKLQKWILKK